MTSRAGTHLLNNPSLDHLGQYNQSRESVSPIPPRSSSECPEPTGTNMLDGEGTGSRLDLPNTGDATLSRRTSSRDASGMNGGHTARKTSSWCYWYLYLESNLNFFGYQIVICKLGVNLATSPARTWAEHFPRIVNPRFREIRANKNLRMS